MRQRYIRWLILLLVLFELQTMSISPTGAKIPLQAITDTTLIYYRLTPGGNCTGPISLGDFIKKTLPNEWIEDWGNTSGGVEALKAGAVAIRTFTISAYHAEIFNAGG